MGKSKDLATRTFNSNLGIGTSTPPQLLSLFGTGAGNSTMQIEGEGGADPTINFLANNTQHFSIGIDDSDSDTFKISEHSALGTNDYFKVDTSGRITLPSQPKFKVRRNSSSVTLTGNNAKQNLVFNVKDFDIGNGYNTTTGKYTVPATGVYFFFLNPRFDGITGSTYARGLIYKGASIPGSPWSDYGNVLSSIDGDGHSTNYHTMNVSGIFSCVAGDTINFLGGGNADSSITFQAESQAGGFMIG